jgi:two-component system, NarL family, nitrate/nitrite response regulator NarL
MVLLFSVMKLLIVDDHPVLREGLAALLRQASEQTEVLQAADDGAGLALADSHADLDAVFLDLNMPGGAGGMPAIQEFGRRRPDLPVIVLSSSEDPQDIRRALALGALGYIPKSASPRTILSALQLVLSGSVYVPPVMLNAMATAASPGSGPQGPAALAHLTDRQIDVLKQLCRGLSNKEISRELNLSEKTVKAHITAIFRTLNVVNRLQAAAVAREAALI